MTRGSKGGAAGPASRARVPGRALRLAHRGDWRAGPENGLIAFRAALANPRCDGLEFDVRGSRDGVPVVLHDETLRRVQGVPRRVEELTAAELAVHGVPTLAEVLELGDGRAFLDVELKGRPVPAVIDVLEAARGGGERGSLRGVVVSSFEPETLAWLGSVRPAWRRWGNTVELTQGIVDAAVGLGCVGLSADWQWIDARSAARVHAAGLELAAWTVRRRSTAARLDRLGVVAICAEAAALDG